MSTEQRKPLSGAFSNGCWAVHVSTVAELIAELQRLPGDMAVSAHLADDDETGADLNISNHDEEWGVPSVKLDAPWEWVNEKTGKLYE